MAQCTNSVSYRVVMIEADNGIFNFQKRLRWERNLLAMVGLNKYSATSKSWVARGEQFSLSHLPVCEKKKQKKLWIWTLSFSNGYTRTKVTGSTTKFGIGTPCGWRQASSPSGHTILPLKDTFTINPTPNNYGPQDLLKVCNRSSLSDTVTSFWTELVTDLNIGGGRADAINRTPQRWEPKQSLQIRIPNSVQILRTIYPEIICSNHKGRIQLLGQLWNFQAPWDVQIMKKSRSFVQK